MPYGGPYAQLPKEISLSLSAVPFSVMTAVTTVHSELSEISVTNTTGSAITLTVQNGQAAPMKLLSAVNIDPATPVILTFDPPAIMDAGISWQASATGLIGTIRGRTKMAYVLGAATQQSNNQPIPA